jgi:flavin reductase (DIM6/NTAB) family NADH-FMN oxidoreductase RutF
MMNKRVEIEPRDLMMRVAHHWLDRWFLLTSGTWEEHNCMTIAWGSIGGMWGVPFLQVVVRPQRYTYEFMERFPTFTVCSFPKELKPALQHLGSRSGREGDKLAATGLTLERSKQVEAPSYAEADLVFECRKIFAQDMDPKGFLKPEIQDWYPKNDYHRMYYGEILGVFSTQN